MHNLSTVIKFEILKQIRKPLFWVAIFAFPVIMIVFGGISFLSTKMAMEQDTKNQDQASQSIKKILVSDQSKLVKLELLAPLETIPISETGDQALNKLNQSDAQAMIIFSSNPAKDETQVYIKYQKSDSATSQLGNGLATLATTALRSSVSSNLSPQITSILSLKSLPTVSHIIGENGKAYNPYLKMITPGIFLAIFFIIFTITGNQMLVATTEEKENRVAEMILTTVQTKTLIIGKIIALTILGFIQIFALLAPIIIMYFIAGKYLNFPPILNMIFANIQFSFWPTFFGITFLIFGFLMTTGLIVLIGSLFPTAQDASQFFTPIIFSMIIPFYFLQAIVSGVSSPIVTFMSYFPFSAPMTLLMRNMAGSLSVSEGIIGLIVIIVSTIIAMLLAVKAFRQGAFEYSKKGSLKNLLFD
ncbi:MAG: ABC transporter permease [Candidatus Saccharibacteria bacterium]|nr:ABC transporter permease [Candidatus Saccharibacteria bacterium]